MSASTLLLLVIVAMNGIAALLACVALFLWVAAQYAGQPISFREAFLSTGKLAVVLVVLGAAGLATWVFLAGKLR